ncbi:dihydroxyacetone kinase subunit L [Superficieibacter electus]|uniref:Dihydroxyacetone kinase subunit L n=1 Tax=Superficieibacter electus TaxID=2022662 RepID=A0A2P5GUT0_9ENTR|nr:dihydroxyacetone kinase subunit DhaL [Superficieibacter electus]POP44285.1 dihydroxyacetone kinase subunit L [Superficieibacter electus]POP50303.1 dihydroxyacetone kinase subunit L [Superficieibacter electus]
MSFTNKDGLAIALAMVKTIQEKKVWLSEIDGAAGDGDHGINMNKGFTLALNKIDPAMNMSEAFLIISQVLLEEIGGSMGPLYGIWFRRLSRESAEHDVINTSLLRTMFSAALIDLQTLTAAVPGDKTLLDVLIPATQQFNAALAAGESCAGSLLKMQQAAEDGFDATRQMYPRVGRASRVGERSVGHPDAGAGSCMLLLQAFTRTTMSLIKKEANHAEAD